uniref:Uncharacterized protein n=1 Tax=Castor canadensis TaxID=51338 RepID=A0A8C0ZVS2_CASCN
SFDCLLAETGKNDWQHSRLPSRRPWRSCRRKSSSSMMRASEGTWNRLNKGKKRLQS